MYGSVILFNGLYRSAGEALSRRIAVILSLAYILYKRWAVSSVGQSACLTSRFPILGASERLPKFGVTLLLSIFLLAGLAAGQSAPDSPSHSKAFWTASLTGGAVTMLDSYSTTLIRPHEQDFFGRGYHACAQESGEPFFYGKEPTVARSYAVGAAKVVVSELVGAWLYRHHHKLWVAPFAYELSAVSGAVKNLEECR